MFLLIGNLLDIHVDQFHNKRRLDSTFIDIFARLTFVKKQSLMSKYVPFEWVTVT